MNTLGAAQAWCAIQVTVFTIAAVLVCSAAHRLGTRAGKQAALSSLLVVALLGLMAGSPWPSWGQFFMSVNEPAEPEVGRLAVESATGNLGASQRLDAVSKPAVQESDRITVQNDSASPSAASLIWDGFVDELRRARVSSTAENGWDWRALAGVALLAVAAIGLLRIAAGIVAVQSLIARSQPVDNEKLQQLVDVLRAELSCARRVEIRQSSRLTTAATVGWRRPVILLPLAWGDWTRDQRRAVLAHELAHIRQADFVAQLAAQFALALHFYHPLVHWLARRLRLEQELTADDLAANVAGGRRAYMNTLAQLALAQPSDSVGWPAQMFLPTRGMFLRRIEMLRDSRHFVAGRGSTAARWAAGGLIVLIGLAAAGLRLPHLSETAPARADDRAIQTEPSRTTQRADAQQGGAHQFDLTYAPESTIYITSFRLAEMSRDPRWKPVATLVNELLDENTWGQWSQRLKAEQIEEASVIVYRTGARNDAGIRTVLRVAPTIDLSKEHARLMPDYDETDLSGRIHLGSFSVENSPYGQSGRRGFILADKQTLIFDHAEQFKSLLAVDAKPEPVHVNADGQILFVGRPEHFKRVIDVEAARGPRDSPMKAFSPLWEETESAQLVIRLADGASMKATAACKSPAAAEKVENTAQALLTLAENLLSHEASKDEFGDSEGQVVQLLFNAGGEALAKARINRKATTVTITSAIPNDKFRALMAPAMRSARDAARRVQSINNLKQIAIAMHVHHEAHKHFPPAVLYGPDGKTPYSWRVALLPYLDQKALYDAYRFDEPWDGPNNRKLLSRIPAVYRHPKDPAGSTSAAYFALTGPDTVFAGKESTQFKHIIDGAASTLMIVESKRMVTGDPTQGDAKVKGRLEVPWTRPDVEIEYRADKPLTELGLGGFFDGGFCAALCDGSVHFFSNAIDDDLLRALITKAGREENAGERLRSLR